MPIQNRITELLGVEYPIVQAPMGWIARSQLASAVSNAGGISELWKIAALAEAYGVAFCPHNPNGPLQVLASLHLAASAQMFGMLEHRHDFHEEFARIGGPLVEIGDDGCCGLPQGVGLGGAPNEAIFSRPVLGKIHESFRPDGAIDDW